METLNRNVKDLNLENFRKEDIGIERKKTLNIYKSKRGKKSKVASCSKNAMYCIVSC